MQVTSVVRCVSNPNPNPNPNPNQMMGGEAKGMQIRPTEPIMAAIRLYMDIINLFLYLLQAMSSGQRD